MFFCACYYFSSRMQTDITATTKASSTVSSLFSTRSHTKEASARKFCSQKRAVMIWGTKTPASNNKNICKKNSLTNFVMLVTDNFA